MPRTTSYISYSGLQYIEPVDFTRWHASLAGVHHPRGGLLKEHLTHLYGEGAIPLQRAGTLGDVLGEVERSRGGCVVRQD
jgi:hypothetical protein